jgi:hypothetical protein
MSMVFIKQESYFAIVVCDQHPIYLNASDFVSPHTTVGLSLEEGGIVVPFTHCSEFPPLLPI